VNDSLDEAALLAALRAAVAARAAVPAAFVEAGRNAYAWHGIDAELASIAYDSLLDAGQPSGVRSESASIRAITFESARFSIGVEITDHALFGQLVPPQPGTAELESRSGQVVSVPIDEVGCFSFGERPGGPFRLRCHTETQADVRTGWVSVSPVADPP